MAVVVVVVVVVVGAVAVWALVVVDVVGLYVLGVPLPFWVSPFRLLHLLRLFWGCTSPLWVRGSLAHIAPASCQQPVPV